MKNKATFFVSVFILLFFSGNAIAQHKAITHISVMESADEFIKVTITSSKPFVFANNTYILHVGNKEFTRKKQSIDHGTGRMTFFIPKEDFNMLPEGDDIYLTYGSISVDDRGDLEAKNNADNVPLWSLGKFSKTLLKK